MPMPFVDMASYILPAMGAPAAVTVKRRAVGSWADGIFTRGAETLISMEAIVQPSGKKQLDKLPENERTRDAINVWTRAKLLISSVEDQQAADVVTWNGKDYEVLAVEDWTEQAQYCLSICARVGVG